MIKIPNSAIQIILARPIDASKTATKSRLHFLHEEHLMPTPSNHLWPKCLRETISNSTPFSNFFLSSQEHVTLPRCRISIRMKKFPTLYLSPISINPFLNWIVTQPMDTSRYRRRLPRVSGAQSQFELRTEQQSLFVAKFGAERRLRAEARRLISALNAEQKVNRAARRGGRTGSGEMKSWNRMKRGLSSERLHAPPSLPGRRKNTPREYAYLSRI